MWSRRVCSIGIINNNGHGSDNNNCSSWCAMGLCSHNWDVRPMARVQMMAIVVAPCGGTTAATVVAPCGGTTAAS